MTQIHKALLLAATMIAMALLANYDFIPATVGQWAPFALLALFPSIWMGKSRKCGAAE